MMAGTALPGGVLSSKRYPNLASFQKDEERMIRSGWTTQGVRRIAVRANFLQRLFRRGGADQFDVRYARPDWPAT